ncbi:MAG: 16S rRNA (guanine(527)-N(7))-methyltransferase RsmG, partial [Desulfobacteraceae bacterium]
MTGAERRLLAGTARRFGVELDEGHLESLGIYLDELFSWNRRVNMTGLKSRDRMLVELIADSVIPVPRLPESGFFLDVGTGPGIPGIPIKILRPGLSAELLEPRGRMNTFLRHVIRLLALQEIRPLRGRIETDRDLLRSEGYSVITARAVAGLAKTLEWCAPH